MTYPHPLRRARGFRPVALLLLVGALALSGCQSTRPVPLAHLKRFTEAERASTVIKYDSWDYIFVLQPAVMDGPYRKILKVEDVGQALRANENPRDLAVVLVGWQFSERDCVTLGEHWRELLTVEGYRRIVCIKALGENKLNGSPVVYDSAERPARAVAAADAP
jgi:hypothetical protein